MHTFTQYSLKINRAHYIYICMYVCIYGTYSTCYLQITPMISICFSACMCVYVCMYLLYVYCVSFDILQTRNIYMHTTISSQSS